MNMFTFREYLVDSVKNKEEKKPKDDKSMVSKDKQKYVEPQVDKKKEDK